MGSIDVVLDMVGGDMAQFNLDALAIDGRIACIGFMRGSQCQLDLIQLLMKRATMTGSTLRRLTVTEKSNCFAAVNEQVMPAIVAGAIQPVIDSIFPAKRRARCTRAHGIGGTRGENLTRLPASALMHWEAQDQSDVEVDRLSLDNNALKQRPVRAAQKN